MSGLLSFPLQAVDCSAAGPFVAIGFLRPHITMTNSYHLGSSRGLCNNVLGMGETKVNKQLSNPAPAPQGARSQGIDFLPSREPAES